MQGSCTLLGEVSAEGTLESTRTKKHERKIRKEPKKLSIKPDVGEYSEQDKIARFWLCKTIPLTKVVHV